MIRQPDFVSKDYAEKTIELVRASKPNILLDKVKFERISDGQCVQILHLGSYDNEPESFALMEEFATYKNLKRLSKVHKEIYLADARKTEAEKLKTVLRFKVSV